ncbi:hypothetical protein [Dactylosporangium sp. CA-233914]|uniref:hypothetical protein n=1 Tax=Dactylosporangium sp. CA-233914 TaxID=3239934 RepID=UPI003D911858
MRRLGLALTALVVLAAACGTNAEKSGTSAGSSAAAEPTPTSAAAPAPPGPLPTVSGADSVEQVMRDLITTAVEHAVGAPGDDRHPEIVVTSGSACGVKVKAIACPPTAAGDKVVININPTLAWQQYQQQVGHGGGDVPLQNAALGAAVQYLTYRDAQRNDPSLLGAGLNDDAKIAKAAQLTMCKNGEVYAGLRTVMAGELGTTWRANLTGKLGDYFSKGMRGEC